jgi:hypothetical protein
VGNDFGTRPDFDERQFRIGHCFFGFSLAQFGEQLRIVDDQKGRAAHPRFGHEPRRSSPLGRTRGPRLAVAAPVSVMAWPLVGSGALDGGASVIVLQRYNTRPKLRQEAASDPK